jgi:putative DNA primase/helicase
MPVVPKSVKPFEFQLNDELLSSTAVYTKPGLVIEFSADTETSAIVSLTEDDIAEKFALKYQDRLRFDHHAKKWFEWTGFRWKVNETEMAFDFARHLCRELRGQSIRMASRKAAEGVEHMARKDQRLAVISDIWDQDPFLLGTPSGTVDLRVGELRPSKPADYITQLVTVSPAPKGTPCPVFCKFLGECTSGDLGFQRFLLQWAGYCLTGDTREQALVFVYGTGGNGKGVFVKVLTEIMGGYAKAAAMDTFVASKHHQHLTALAMLDGARLVTASETEQNQRWSEGRINQLTGNDPVTANYMRHDHFTFMPKFKLLFLGNHKPIIGAVNQAARRRYIVVPFVYKPQVPDKELEAKLRLEYPAILRLMIDGCLDWQANGLVRPGIVTATTSEYFEEQDLIGRWIEEKCDLGPGKIESATKLYASFREFAVASGEDPGSSTSFGSALSQRNFKKKKMNGGINYYLDIAVSAPK